MLVIFDSDVLAAVATDVVAERAVFKVLVAGLAVFIALVAGLDVFNEDATVRVEVLVNVLFLAVLKVLGVFDNGAVFAAVIVPVGRAVFNEAALPKVLVRGVVVKVLLLWVFKAPAPVVAGLALLNGVAGVADEKLLTVLPELDANAPVLRPGVAAVLEVVVAEVVLNGFVLLIELELDKDFGRAAIYALVLSANVGAVVVAPENALDLGVAPLVKVPADLVVVNVEGFDRVPVFTSFNVDLKDEVAVLDACPFENLLSLLFELKNAIAPYLSKRKF